MRCISIERILGDSDFVEKILKEAHEDYEQRYKLVKQGYDIDKIAEMAAAKMAISSKEIFQPGKQPAKVKARSLFCYWAVRKLGYTMVELAQMLNISQPSVSVSVKRGERIVLENELSISNG